VRAVFLRSAGLADPGLASLFDLQYRNGKVDTQKDGTVLAAFGPTMSDFIAGKSVAPYGSVAFLKNAILVEFPRTTTFPTSGKVTYIGGSGKSREHSITIKAATPIAIADALKEIGLMGGITSIPGCGLSEDAIANLRYAAGVNKYFHSDSTIAAESISDLRMALNVDPNFHIARAQLAQAIARMVHRRWYDDSESLPALREAVSLAGTSTVECPESDQAWKALGMVYQASARYFDASRIPVSNLGTSCLNNRDLLQSSLAAYRTALDLNRNNFWAYSNLISLYATMDQPDSSEAAFRHATQLLPSAAEPFINLADARIERYIITRAPLLLVDAEALLDSAQQRNPDLGLIYFNRACARSASGDVDSAAQLLAQAFNLGDYEYRRLLLKETSLGRPFAGLDAAPIVATFANRQLGRRARDLEKGRLQLAPLGLVLGNLRPSENHSSTDQGTIHEAASR
jgi:tetratricopeptide (TPR) repeat protein